MASFTPTQPALSWCIVGRGAIGLLASSRLQLAGYSPRLWLKQPEDIELLFTDLQQHRQQLLLPSQPCSEPISQLLIPVKAYDICQAVSQLLPYLTDTAQLVLCHNGMIALESILKQLVPGQGLWFLSTSQAAYKPAVDQVVHSGAGNSYLAKLTAPGEQDPGIIEAMSAALGPLTVVADINPLLWQKLAINAAINPLTALENCPNGQLAQRRYQAQITALVNEVCQVASALGYPLDSNATIARVLQVIDATARNYSSMQQDVQAGRPTEIEAICGYICRQAAQLQIAVPANLHMLNQIRVLTAKR
ncbi:hypothetical protein WG68_16950 [Arsukibacterium ikkense]|uniref:2-dehydropantoate 2-reductase n=1 Tax=Arsukibacterium ikkense TaxID=336831 RepID=A0A0M2V4R4_9GAMM|nr:2-dehydropantoate 2-reductase [Arsukibacterium ikkense]KKO44148.1 hypothetical protein WG68_16950 [Arsukibacterium ikkense]